MEKRQLVGQKLDFSQTPFNLLMQKRIQQVLIICSNYDFYMLEEDGRIDEQIYNEYVSLNLRYPPIFLHTDSAKQAFEILEHEKVDLVIEMLSIGDVDTFELAKQIKSKYSTIPIVVLTHFSREVSLRLQNEDLSAIEYVFCWLGNADLLVAIIKLIEDRMNVEFDVDKVGVQVILLAEDSVRFISSYLPNLYKIILKQSREFMKEALNEHQKMLRARGRPKILLSTTYEDALKIYERYKFNLLGIISDVSFKKKNKDIETRDGLELCRHVKSEDMHMPVLLQSSDASNEIPAKEMGAGFINKASKTLSIELRNFVVRNFGFGEFTFRDPDTMQEIARAADLQALQHLILKIPDSVLQYHTRRNEISKWLNARALFPIGQMFKFLSTDDFPTLDELRNFIYESIANFRMSKGRGVIAEFDKESFDEYLIFSRIGEGSIGGKARGLAFLDALIKKHNLFYKYDNIIVTIPWTVVIGTDIFDEFLESNDLLKVVLSDISDENLMQRFLVSQLPGKLYQDLYALVSALHNPVAVRSSSKLEDSHYQPFAGIYSTYMVPLVQNDKPRMVRMITDAIKCVYASVFFKSSKAYMAATSNVIDEEKMGIIIQEVCGNPYGNRFYPSISGVARSINFYPIKPERPEDGIVNLAFGLGKYIVDGGSSLRFSPRYPKKILQLSTPEMALRDTQKTFYALDLSQNDFTPTTDDGFNLHKLSIREAENDAALKYVASTFDQENNSITEGMGMKGRRLITFSKVLNHNIFPLAEIVNDILSIGQRQMNNPIEIEFAVNLDTPPNQPKIFNALQIRPIVLSEQTKNIQIDEYNKDQTILYSDSALGNGVFENLTDIIYVRPETFNASFSNEIALKLEKLNEEFQLKKKNFVLIGPGRWGSSDPWLGIPIKWGQISEARIIIESGLDQYRIDPSQGTHFFQNLTSFRVGYMTVNPYINDGFYDVEYLANLTAEYEDKFIRHIHFESPMLIKIDGKNNRGIIIKPGAKSFPKPARN
jgi:CheY-like chemotaxis protein